jgi:hypothetical protein
MSTVAVTFSCARLARPIFIHMFCTSLYSLAANNIGDLGVAALGDALTHSKTLKTLL